MKDLITKLESKVKDCNNTNTIFDTRKYVLLSDVKELLEAINYTSCCKELLCDCEERTFYEWEKFDNMCSECDKPLYAK